MQNNQRGANQKDERQNNQGGNKGGNQGQGGNQKNSGNDVSKNFQWGGDKSWKKEGGDMDEDK